MCYLKHTPQKKHIAKKAIFSPGEEVEIQVIKEEMLRKRITKETTHESIEFPLSNYCRLKV